MRLTGARPVFLTLSGPTSARRTARSLRLRVSSSLAASLRVRVPGGRTQTFAVSRRARRLTVRIPRGTKTLRLALSLKAGRAASARTLSVARR